MMSPPVVIGLVRTDPHVMGDEPDPLERSAKPLVPTVAGNIKLKLVKLVESGLSVIVPPALEASASEPLTSPSTPTVGVALKAGSLEATPVRTVPAAPTPS